MATKTNLISAINAQITAVITQAKHRLSMLEIVNTLFQTTYVQEDFNPSAFINYSLRFKKIGNVCWVSGYIQNISPDIIAGDNITITNSLYYGKTSIPFNVSVVSETGANGTLSLGDSVINLLCTLSPDENIYINFNYEVND